MVADFGALFPVGEGRGPETHRVVSPVRAANAPEENEILAPVSEDTLSRAEELMMNRDFDAAREVYAQLTEERPTDMMGWHGLGTTYLIEGNLEEAVPALEKAWQKAGGECDSQRMLFLAEFARGSIGRCAEILEEIKDEQFHVA